MDSNNILDVQHQIRENSEDLQKYLLDLECWEKEMKKKEEELKLIQTTPEEEIPPIRNSLYRSKRKNRHKKQKEKNSADKASISTTDYQAWENFDADAELKKIDEEIKHSSASENSENEDEFYFQKRKQLAILHKDKGNEFFKSGNYDSAINSYTTGMLIDPENPLLAANRAMAFLKKEQFQAAENDCTLCLSVDPTYVKAYMRRGTARKNLNKFSLAKDDFSKALELEPDNKQAKAELKKLSEESTIENGSDVLRCEVAETQELWPHLLSSKPVECSEKPIQEATRAQVGITEIDEKNFAHNVESKKNDPKVSELNKIRQLEEKLQNSQIEPPLPPVPNTSFQFLTDWNEIAPFPTLRYEYLKQFPPKQLPVFFKHYMEPVIFPKLLETLSTSFIENGDDVFEYMKYLTGIGRFTTMIMFLSDKEECDLKRLLEYIKLSKRPELEISDVLKKYQT